MTSNERPPEKSSLDEFESASAQFDRDPTTASDARQQQLIDDISDLSTRVLMSVDGADSASQEPLFINDRQVAIAAALDAWASEHTPSPISNVVDLPKRTSSAALGRWLSAAAVVLICGITATIAISDRSLRQNETTASDSASGTSVLRSDADRSAQKSTNGNKSLESTGFTTSNATTQRPASLADKSESAASESGSAPRTDSPPGVAQDHATEQPATAERPTAQTSLRRWVWCGLGPRPVAACLTDPTLQG